MSTVGAVNDATLDAWRGSGIGYMTPFVMPEAGTLDSISVYMRDQGSNDDYRIGLYEGGSSTSINGATLVWDSGVIDFPSSGTGAWDTTTAGSESLTGSAQMWVVVQTDFSSQIGAVNSGAEGDLDLLTDYWWNTHGYLAGGFPSTANAEDGNQSYSQAIKAIITYTAGGGGGGLSIPVANQHFRNIGMRAAHHPIVSDGPMGILMPRRKLLQLPPEKRLILPKAA